MYKAIRFKALLLTLIGLFAQAQLFGQFDDLKKKELLDVANRLVVERDSVQQLVEEARASIALLTEQKEVQSGEIDLLRTDIVDRDATIDELEADIASRVSEIEVLEKNVAALNDEIAELNRQLNVQEVLWNDHGDSLKAVIALGNPTDSLSRVIQRLEGELQAAKAATTQMKNSSTPQWNPNATFLNRVYSNLESIDSQSLKLELVGVYTKGAPVAINGDAYYEGDKPWLGRYYEVAEIKQTTCFAGTYPTESFQDFIACRGVSSKYGCESYVGNNLGLPPVSFEFLRGKLLTIRTENSEDDWMMLEPEFYPVEGEKGFRIGIIDENEDRFDLFLREYSGELVFAIPHSLALRLKIVDQPSFIKTDDSEGGGVFGSFSYMLRTNHYGEWRESQESENYFSRLPPSTSQMGREREVKPLSYTRNKSYSFLLAKETGFYDEHNVVPLIYFFRLVP
ncbi:MAG: hypothetical protein O2818_04680 [Bacteroidetes bacterium]|nr:hypothetical protein [Bacteroidota bacterium]